MTSPIDKMILGAVRCTICGAKYGECSCWAKCEKCGCSYETGKHCGRCAGEPLKVIASGNLRISNPKK